MFKKVSVDVNKALLEQARKELKRDIRAEKIAEEYYAIMAENGVISHKALSESQFYQLCTTHELFDVSLREILISSMEGLTPLEVLSYYHSSPPHNAAIFEEKGEGLVARKEQKDLRFSTALLNQPSFIICRHLNI